MRRSRRRSGLQTRNLALGRQIDREAVLEGMDAQARKRAEYQRQYRETHKDEQAEYMRRYRRRKRMGAEGNVNDLQD